MPTQKENVRNRIFSEIDDMVTKFFYYDRQEDDELPVGSIEKALMNNTVTGDELADFFKARLHESGLNKGLAKKGYELDCSEKYMCASCSSPFTRNKVYILPPNIIYCRECLRKAIGIDIGRNRIGEDND